MRLSQDPCRSGRLKVAESLDYRAARRLARHLREITSGDLVVDLSAVSYIDMPAMATLLMVDHELREQSRHLILWHPSACVEQALRLCGAGQGGPLQFQFS